MTEKGLNVDKNHCALCGRKRTELEPQRTSISIDPYSETIWPVPGGKPAECRGTSTMTHAYISIRRNGGEDKNTHICLQCATESLVSLRNEIDRILGETTRELPEPTYDESVRFALYCIKQANDVMRVLRGQDNRKLIDSDPVGWSHRLRLLVLDFCDYYERLAGYFPGINMDGIHEEPLTVNPVAYVEGIKEFDRRFDETMARAKANEVNKRND